MSKRAEFLAKAATARDGDGCMVWPFAVRASSGYGAHNLPAGGRRKINVDAHVHACTLAHGERPSRDHQAAHSCGNKLCCNGEHLRWATRIENMADAKAHGTLKGGGRYRQRLHAPDVAAIRASRESLLALGRRFGMDPSYIGRVRRGGCHARG